MKSVGKFLELWVYIWEKKFFKNSLKKALTWEREYKIYSVEDSAEYKRVRWKVGGATWE